MPRLSCSFCIFAPPAALILAGKHRPDLLAEYVQVERETGHTFRKDLSLVQIQKAVDAIRLRGDTAPTVTDWRM